MMYDGTVFMKRTKNLWSGAGTGRFGSTVNYRYGNGIKYQNKKLCYYKSLPKYQLPASNPGTYRYYPTGNVFSSNHFSQSPNTYNTTSGTNQYK